MTCKDCLCFDQCTKHRLTQYVFPNYVQNVEDKCLGFKNRNKFIELPCNIGDTAYIANRMKKRKGDGFLTQVTIVGVHLRDEKTNRNLPREEYLVVRSHCGFSRHININKIGIDLFFNREEALLEVKGK